MESGTKTKVLIPLICLCILSIRIQGQVPPVFELSHMQLPPVEYEALDSITLVAGNVVLLDTIVRVNGTANYSIDWFVLQNGKYVNTQNLMEVNKDTRMYFLIAYNETCTFFDSTLIQSNEATSHTRLFSKGGNIAIYPNPSGGKIYIDVEDMAGSVDICLFDLGGHKILGRTAEIPENNFTLELDLFNLHAGIYIVEVVSGNRRSHQKISLIK